MKGEVLQSGASPYYSFNNLVTKDKNMIRNNRHKKTSFVFGMLLLMFLFAGCIKDDLSDCPVTYRLVVQTDPNDDVQLRTGTIMDNKVILFIFDENNRLLDYRRTSPGQVMELTYSGHRRLNAVAWANLDGQMDLSALSSQTPLENAKVQLAERVQLSDGKYAYSPNDLFQGKKELNLTIDTQNRPDVLIIGRKVAAIRITTRHLKEFVGTTDYDFTYRVRGSKNTFDFNGNLLGDDRNYLPVSSFNPANEFVAPAFLVFPNQTDKKIAVDIYKGDNLIYTMDTDGNGLPIRAERGKLLDLIIDFSAGTNVTISIKDWDDKEIDQEF